MKINIDVVKNIIKTKKTKICLAADVDTMDELFNIIDQLGDHICILKLHHDIINDFNDNMEKNINKLNKLKTKHNFLIWEDRKFADIGFVMEKQINNHISKWADLVSIHPIAGKESVKYCLNNTDIGIILIGEMSSSNQLINKEYQNEVVKITQEFSNIIGIVCQHKMTDNLLNIVPGISLKMSEDNKGQKYNSINNRLFADIFVVGRSICKSINPLETLNQYNIN